MDFNSINNNNSEREKRIYIDNAKSNKINIFENEEYIPQKKIINLYENAFKNLILNSKKKDIMNHPKKIDNMKIIYKYKRYNYLSNTQKKINSKLPPISNFNINNNIALINNNKNKDCKNILQYNNKLINNNRYKIDNY